MMEYRTMGHSRYCATNGCSGAATASLMLHFDGEMLQYYLCPTHCTEVQAMIRMILEVRTISPEALDEGVYNAYPERN